MILADVGAGRTDARNYRPVITPTSMVLGPTSNLGASQPFLATDIAAPPLRLVRRHLDSDLDRWVPLTVVRGPAGYGKSTLVRQWAANAESAGIRVLWCAPTGSVDLCTAVLAALAGGAPVRVTEHAAGDLLEACAEAQRLIDGYDGRTVLVVDGLDDLARGDLIGQLLELARRRHDFRVLVTTRVRDKAEDLVALTLGVQVIQPRDLLLSRAEIVGLAALRGVRLNAEHAELIRRHVGGWPILVDAVLVRVARRSRIDATGIAVAAAAAQEGLWSHVLRSSLSQSDVDALAELSTAERLTTDAARFLTADPEIEQTLVHLESVGALSSEMGADGTPLFWIPPAISRIARAHATTATDHGARSAELARYLARTGQSEMAVVQAYACGNWQLVSEIFEHGWLDLWVSEDPAVRRALIEIPAAGLSAFPRTLAAQRIVTDTPLTPAELGIPATRSPAELRQIAHIIGLSSTLQTSVLEAIALRRSGRFSDALSIARTAAEISDSGDGMPRELRSVVPYGRYELALTALLAGDHELALHQIQAATRWFDWSSPAATKVHELIDGLSALKVAVQGDLLASDVRVTRARRSESTASQFLLLRDDQGIAATIAEAATAIDRLDRASTTAALNVLRTGDQGHELWGFAAWCQARSGLFWGNRRGALRDLAKARRLHGQTMDDGGLAYPLLIAAEANLLIADRRANRVASLLAAAPVHPTVAVARARLALLIGDYDSAIVETLRVISDDGVLDRLCLEALLVHAAARTKAMGVEHAVVWWRQALALASRLGSPLAPFALLPAGMLASVEPHVPELRVTLRELVARSAADMMPARLEIIELSPRQQSVLEALARGIPIPAIARSQFVSPNTIKSQLRALYGKLGAHSREEAVAVARDAGLIGS